MRPKYSFLFALIFTLVIFFFGLLFGFFLEETRAKSIDESLLKSEVNLLDEQTRESLFENFDVQCGVAEENLFSFADRIYAEAQKLERYDSVSKFSDSLKIIHRRYDLLRVMLWSEAVDLKKNCKSDFHTVVYFFDYGSNDLDIKAKQSAYSRMLADLKGKYGNSILLIPIAANLNLSSVDVILESYNIPHVPSILIDENVSLSDFPTFSELETSIFKRNKS